MRKLFYHTSVALILVASSFCSNAQSLSFGTMDSINVNKLNAAVLVHGDMFWSPFDYSKKCKFPYSAKKNVMGPTGLWISGYDAAGLLHLSAQTYRQDGNDFWPGALPDADTLSYETSFNWSKIWKLSRADIQNFQTIGTHTVDNTHPAILTWPASGNTYAAGVGGVPLLIPAGARLAPFIDQNGNGVYEPLSGDYPDVPGDQALWYVFSDNGPYHTSTNGRRLGLEIQATSYAYRRWTLIDNVVYYRYKIVNKSANTYHDVRFSVFADVELGYFRDDYIGYDSAYRMGIVYNSDNNNGSDGGGFTVDTGAEYHFSLPMAGITCVHMSGFDAAGPVPMGAFTYFRNDLSTAGYPTVDYEYDNYMRGRTRGGAHFAMDYTGSGIQATGTGSGPVTKFVFPGDPADLSAWSECSAGNNFGDRNFLLTCPDIPSLAPGEEWEVTFALVASDPATDQWCSAGGFSKIKVVADTAWNVYTHPLPPIPLSLGAVGSISPMRVYPNPASGHLYVETAGSQDGAETVTLCDMLGVTVISAQHKRDEKWTMDISNVAPGMYQMVYFSKGNLVRVPVSIY